MEFLRWVIAWAVLFGVYLLFTDTTEFSEVIAGLLVGAGVAVTFRLSRQVDREGFSLQLQWLWRFWRVPGAEVWETLLLARALARQIFTPQTLNGNTKEYAYSPETEDAYSPGRRALMTIGICITPNSYVIDIRREKRKVIIRQLVGKELSISDEVFLCLP